MEDSLKAAWQNWQKMQEKSMEFWKDTMTRNQPYKVAEKINEPFRDMWTEWWKNQEEFLNLWKDSVSSAEPDRLKDIFSGPYRGVWQEWWKYVSPSDLQDKMSEMFGSGEFPEKVKKFYQDWYKMASGSAEEYFKTVSTATGKETFEKLMQSANVYTRLLTFWSEMASRLPAEGEIEKWMETYQKWAEDYGRVLESFFTIFFPEQLRGLMVNPSESLSAYQQFFFNMFQPWLGSSNELQKNFLLALKGDRDAYLEFLKGVNEAYQESVGKHFGIPGIGITKENLEKLANSMESFMVYTSSINEITSTLYKIGFETWEALMKKIGALAAEGKAPESFKEVYQLWWKVNEEAYFNLFKTEEFGKMLGKTTEAWARFREKYENLASDMLSYLPVPNRKEMDSLEKTVYQLKRTVREQAKKIEELNKKLDAFKKGGGGEVE
ncbi:MAG: hypothetical protein HPY50_18855 [Firmicutes bacterium]|nr:hypothetical protein [Bacillota bacterium]